MRSAVFVASFGFRRSRRERPTVTATGPAVFTPPVCQRSNQITCVRQATPLRCQGLWRRWPQRQWRAVQAKHSSRRWQMPSSEATIFVCSGIGIYSCCCALHIAHQVHEIMPKRPFRRIKTRSVWLCVITFSRPYVKRVSLDKPSSTQADDKPLDFFRHINSFPWHSKNSRFAYILPLATCARRPRIKALRVPWPRRSRR